MIRKSHILSAGKLDPQFLDSLIKKYTTRTNFTKIGAALGEDAAVLDIGVKYLIAKTDPITFATDYIGYYAVHINANDIWCMGAQPRWFLATLLLPENKTTPYMVEEIFKQIAETCQKEEIAYCGGHTEITVNLDRPLVIGHMLGDVDKDKVILKSRVQKGDRVILIQPVPIEGTSIIAREKCKELEAYFSAEFLNNCQNLLINPGISIRKSAETALSVGNIHAMHDPTEGGLATALYELAAVTNKSVHIHFENILFLPEALKLCRHYNLNPLGCISSGSLIVVANSENSQKIINACRKSNLPAADIGYMASNTLKNTMFINGKIQDLPVFVQDEIVKLF